MKKLLLLASLALTASAAWAYDNPLGQEKVYDVDLSHGSIYRAGESAPNKWCSRWTSTDKEPEVVFSTTLNNITNVSEGSNLVFAAGASGCTFTISAENTNWYVSKIEFDCVSEGDDGPRIVVGEDAVMLGTTLQHFEREFAYDEDAVFSLSGKNYKVTTTNFRVTIQKMDQGNLADRVIKKYSFTEFVPLWTSESAQAVNDAILAKAASHADSETDVAAIDAELRQLAEQQLVEVLLPEANDKYVTFRDRHTSRYMAAFKAGETDGETEIAQDCTRMITNGDDMHAIWRLTYDQDAKKIRFHHYLTNLDLGNNNEQNVALPVFDHANINADAPGALFTLRPVRINTAGQSLYVVEMEDATDAASLRYIHDNPDMTAPIKWNAAETSPGSGWFLSVLDINPDGELAGLLDLKNKPVVVYDVDANKYLAKVGENGIGLIDELRPSAVWNVNIEDADHFENGEIEIKHVVSGKYANNLTDDLAATSNSTLKVIDYVDEHASWYIVSNRSTNVAPEGAHHYIINEVTAEQKAQMVEDMKPYLIYELGNEPSTYSFGNDADDATYNELKGKVDEINGEEFDYVTADAIFNLPAPSLFDVNAIAGPALVRIKTAPANTTTVNAYITNSNNDSNSGRIAFNWDASASTDDNTVFVLHDHKLSALVGGSYLMTDDRTSAPHIWNPENTSGEENDGVEVSFEDITAKEPGAYMFNYGSDATYSMYMLYCNNGLSDRSGFVSLESAMANNNWARLAYNVEYVNQLSVAVENGYKLWRAPVTVNFGDYADNGAYVVEVKNNTITTEAAEADTNYGAGTIFMLTKNIIANCVNGDATAAKVAGVGHHAVKNHTFSAGKVYLTVHEDQSAEEVAPAAQGLYFDAPEVEKVRMLVSKYDEDTTVALDAHSPAIEAENTTDAPLAHGDAIMLPLGGSTDTTEILEIAGVKQAADGIFDLQGRRLAAPVKGLNIINGQKTIVK